MAINDDTKAYAYVAVVICRQMFKDVPVREVVGVGLDVHWQACVHIIIACTALVMHIPK